uniref:Uncharacterized protein n=1 Tax=Cyanistes caeruleus TaxID=156563 RepID=A0A8C0UPX1_CYACU
MKAFGEFSFPVSVYSGSYSQSGFEIEAPNLTKKKQIQMPLPAPKIQPRAVHCPARFSVLRICQQGLGETTQLWDTIIWQKERKITCFSSSQMVSSDTLFLNFFTWVMLLLLTFLRASLDLLVDCLASLARLSLCIDTHLGTGTRITVPSTSGLRFMPLSLIAFLPSQCVLTSGKLVMFTIMSCGDFCEICPSWAPQRTKHRDYQPGEVLTLRFLLNSSFRASMTACISSLVCSKLIISSTRAALIFTLA